MLVDTTHPWIYPRAQGTSFHSGRPLVPVWSLVGPIDKRLGKQCGVFISVCEDVHGGDGVYEIVLQDPSKPSKVDAYFAGGDRAFTAIHLSCQVHWNGKPQWAVIEHDCDKGFPGFHSTTHVKSRKDADKLFAERIAAQGGKRVAAPKPWYRDVLAEIDRHHRLRGQKPQRVRMRVAIPPHAQAIGPGYGDPGYMFINGASHYVGGSPRYCQEEWDDLPDNPCSKQPMLHVVTLGRCDLGWSEILNDGDMGSLAFFVAPGDPFGAMSFSCH
jgi:hypothetical protein